MLLTERAALVMNRDIRFHRRSEPRKGAITRGRTCKDGEKKEAVGARAQRRGEQMDPEPEWKGLS